MKTGFLFILFFFVAIAFGQTTESDTTKKEQLYVVIKLDGTEYIGKILSDDGREVLIETEALGKIYIPKSEIRSIQKIEDPREIVYGEFQTQGPFTTRYYFTTNGHPIKKGENYAMLHLYGPEVHFALTNNFSLGVMSTWGASPLVLALKYSFKTKTEKINLALGTLMGTSGYLNTFKGFGGLHWGSITIGDRKRNLTFSGGYGYIQTGLERSIYAEGTYTVSPTPTFVSQPLVTSPMFSIAGIIKVGAKASFVFDSMVGLRTAEQYFVEEQLIGGGYVDSFGQWVPEEYQYVVTKSKNQHVGFFVMPGMRFQSSERRAFQVALAGVTVFKKNDRAYSFPFPMVSWFFKF